MPGTAGRRIAKARRWRAFVLVRVRGAEGYPAAPDQRFRMTTVVPIRAAA